MALVIETLREEHRDIARLLDALEHQIDVFERADEPDYDVIRGVADYFLEFPDRCHHPKEDQVFARLKAADPKAAAEIGDLPSEHRLVHERIGRFARDLQALLGETDIARDVVVDAARQFIEAERRHMQMEEERFFPLAEKALTAEDWSILDRALAQSADPRFGDSAARLKQLSQRLIAWEAESR